VHANCQIIVRSIYIVSNALLREVIANSYHKNLAYKLYLIVFDIFTELGHVNPE
jgi:hypothetical protein